MTKTCYSQILFPYHLFNNGAQQFYKHQKGGYKNPPNDSLRGFKPRRATHQTGTGSLT